MDIDFTGHPLFAGSPFNRPTRFEAEVFDCEVEGRIPSDMNGSFYRLQCDFAYRPPDKEWLTGFNGDGHLSLFRFREGHVDYRSRYIRTDRLMAERAARKRLFGVYRNRLTDDPSVAHVDRGAANTHVFWHGGKLMVLKEDSHPYLVDPHSLETLGRWDFDGRLTAASFSAHPKIDPLTGEMIGYAYQAKGDLSDDIAVYIIDPSGRIVREVWLKSPYLGVIHDIALTRNHVVIPVIPLVASRARLEAGEPMWDWSPDHPTMVGVLPRDGEARDVRWFRGPPRMTFHFLNAVERDGRIDMELPVSDTPGSPSRIMRWSFDLNRPDDGFGETAVAAGNSPLARMDDRYISRPYRYGFVGHADTARPHGAALDPAMRGRISNTWQRFDLASGEVSSFYVGDHQGLQECCFVPRGADAPEGDGYLIGVASNYADMSSDLVIVDAQRLEEGAVATVKLPFRLRSGTHGAWMPASEIPTA